jgi:hypothetical protein
MSRHRKFAMLMLMSVALAPFAMAQTPQPPPSSSDPSSASSPHQEKATQEQMMKDCMKKGHQKDSSMSKDQLKKNCQDEMMKMQQQPKG